MKKLIVGMAVWLAVGTAWAADEAGSGAKPSSAAREEQFKANKALQVQMLEEKLACVKAASSVADMKRCHDAQKARHQGEQLKRIEEQRRKLDEREKSLKERQSQQTAPAK